VNYRLVVEDPRTVARVINMAHRFQCRATRVDARSTDTTTTADFEFSGPQAQLDRLRAQIDRIVEFERTFI
jgi:hypothetical protein